MPRLLDLFCGTKSIGKVFGANGWTVTSVDLEPKFEPDVCCNVLDLTPEMIGEAPDLIWASPPCTHYSVARTTAKTPRDLEGSDRLVQKVLDLREHYGCHLFMENPYGLLMRRPVVNIPGLHLRLVDYCKYADEDHPHKGRKRTCIWTTTRWEPKRPLCRKDCGYTQDGRHLDVAQRGGNPRRGTPSHGLEELYAIPRALPRELCEYVNGGGE